jgi:hypothetical protein
VRHLIVDFHVGCIQSLLATVHDDQSEIHIISYSNHNFLFTDLIQSAQHRADRFTRIRVAKALFGIQGVFSKRRDTNRALKERKVSFGRSRYDIVWCCFPPGIYKNLVNSKIAIKTVVVISHRMDLGIKLPSERKVFWQKIKCDLNSGFVTFVAANAYDAKYFEYYTETKIPVVDIHTPYIQIPLASPEMPILIGPSNISADTLLVQNLRDELPNIRTIKEIYLNYTYEDLAKHMAFIVLPYSIYSISIMELSRLGVPILIPTDEFLLANGLLIDVTLFPLYGTKAEISEFEEACTLMKPGPNCDCFNCRKFWLQFAFWKQLPNVIYWNSISELKLLIEGLENGYTPSESLVLPITLIQVSEINKDCSL